ncbi:MAG: hypothetical protein ACFNZJ_07025, partial [Parascardovia denticolens]
VGGVLMWCGLGMVWVRMVWCITAGMRLIRQMPRRIMISMLFVMTGLSRVQMWGGGDGCQGYF